MEGIFLAQSDTTAGFLSADSKRLNYIKGRKLNQQILLTTSTLSDLKSLVRVPNAHKNRIRKSTKSTFIYRNMDSLAVRFVHKSNAHSKFLRFFPFLYSTSANAHKMGFSLDFALQKADIVVIDNRFLESKNASKMYKISNTNIKRIR